MSQISLLQVKVGPMENFAYILACTQTKQAVLIDPGFEGERLYQEVLDAGFELQAVWLTHTHFDHLRSLPEVLAKKQVPVFVHELEKDQLPEGNIEIHVTQEGSVLSLGELQVQCYHTPGHSPGGQCFQVADIFIVGDTLFVDGCGRVDLPGSDPVEMGKSFERLKTFPDEWVIYPGHDYGHAPSDLLGNQKKQNAFFHDHVRFRV